MLVTKKPLITLIFAEQCDILSFLSISESWFLLKSFLPLDEFLYDKYCLQHMHVLWALRGERIYIWGKWYLKDNKWLKTRTSRSTDGYNFFLWYVNYIKWGVFKNICLLWRAKLLLENTSVQFFTWHYLLCKLAKIHWVDALFVPWLVCC